MNWKSLVDQAQAAIVLPKEEKSTDPRYDEAKKLFKGLSKEIEPVLSGLVSFKTNIEALAAASMRMATNVNSWTMDGDQQIRQRTASVLSTAQKYEQLTKEFMSPRFETNVIVPLTAFQKEIVRTQALKHNHKRVRDSYDLARKKFNHAHKKNESASKLQKLDQDLQAARTAYEENVLAFVQSVNHLNQYKSQALYEPMKRFVALVSQYIGASVVEVAQLNNLIGNFVQTPLYQPPGVPQYPEVASDLPIPPVQPSFGYPSL